MNGLNAVLILILMVMIIFIIIYLIVGINKKNGRDEKNEIKPLKYNKITFEEETPIKYLSYMGEKMVDDFLQKNNLSVIDLTVFDENVYLLTDDNKIIIRNNHGDNIINLYKSFNRIFNYKDNIYLSNSDGIYKLIPEGTIKVKDIKINDINITPNGKHIYVNRKNNARVIHYSKDYYVVLDGSNNYIFNKGKKKFLNRDIIDVVFDKNGKIYFLNDKRYEKIYLIDGEIFYL